MKGLEKITFAVFLFACSFAQAQSFAWKSSLDTVPQTGFYTIALSPQWLTALKMDISDVRIKDERGGTIPFILKQSRPYKQAFFLKFPILKNTTDSAFTTVELDAGNRTAINHLELVLGNTAVERKASLSGSNDRKEWFIVDESLFLKNKTGYDKEQFVQTLVLPTIHYRYLKLQIHNGGTDPLLIKEAGVFTEWSLDETRDPHFKKQAIFQQHDSTDGYSYIRVDQQADYPVETLWVHLYGPKFYARELNIYNGQNPKGAELIASAKLQSNTDVVINVQPVKMKSFLVTIENGDNPPLKVDSVAVQFTQRTLIAYLEKDRRYSLLGGNPSLSIPVYDLALFRDSLPINLPQVGHGPVLPFEQGEIAVKQASRWWLWPSIIGAVIMLAFLSLQLLRDVKRKEQ